MSAGMTTRPTRRTHSGYEVPTRKGPTGGLVVACILDEFSYACFEPEAELVPLTMRDWRVELLTSQPDLLLVESAWRGHEDTWWNEVSRNGPEIRGILAWCRERGIPTAFWNKEDPVHFSTFLTLASSFDTVFTTDVDCVPRYRARLGHDNVHFLPFAAQPTIHNPVETFDRVDGCAFAGAYYARYPHRNEDLRELSNALIERGRFDIYDRNHGKEMPGYEFPHEYHTHIRGGLDPSQIDQAYKGYTSNLNLNSVKQSQSMFARRVYELLASNTRVVSNYSRGLRTMFGDLVVSTDDGTEMHRRLEAVDAQPNGAERLRWEGVRKVMSEHTYAHRLEFIAQTSGLRLPEGPSVRPLLTLRARDRSEIMSSISMLQSQTHEDWVLLVDGADQEWVEQVDDRIVHSTTADLRQLAQQRDCTHLGALEPGSYYAPEYLADLVLTLRWARCQAAGHSEAFELAPSGAVVRTNVGTAHSWRTDLALGRSLLLVESWDHLPWELTDLGGCVPTAAGPGLSVGTAAFLAGGAGATAEQVAPVARLRLDTGLALQQMRDFSIAMRVDNEDDEVGIDVSLLVRSMPSHPSISIEVEDTRVTVCSTLASGEHSYIYADELVPLDALPRDESGEVYLQVSPGLDLMMTWLYFDAAGTRVGHSMVGANRNSTMTLPESAVAARLGLRVSGSGEAVIERYLPHALVSPPHPVMMRGDHVVITNVYPSYSDLYRNGFVHSRLRSYAEEGVPSEVYLVGAATQHQYREFEDIDVTVGNSEGLARTLAAGAARSALVHFLDPAMWAALRQADLDSVIVWVHGSEVQPWWRRTYNYTDDDALSAAKVASRERMSFWRELFGNLPDNVHFVFVSQYFADEVFADVGIPLPSSRYSIIHNPIDPDLFSYEPKPAEQRRRILTIRPYASNKYANDLSVAAVLLLSERPGFEKLDFHFVGDGALWHETTRPLEKLANVTLDRRFLNHQQIADLHRCYGVFLTPTRMDAQGVSRDEAMSSGLVPITTEVAAVPEFVDADCGFLAAPEDPVGLAEAIWAVAHDEDGFARLSAAAAARVRSQTSAAVVIPQEIALITNLAAAAPASGPHRHLEEEAS